MLTTISVLLFQEPEFEEYGSRIIMTYDPTVFLIKIPVLLFSITIHEYAHGRVAYLCGDPTAKNMGRLTLNPLPHIDVLGAICLFLMNFGWAKPVPVNTTYFKKRKRYTILMALAGPFSNLSIALIAGMLIRFFFVESEMYLTALMYLLIMNIGLGLFNLLPIPPLDGSHVLENSLWPKASRKFARVKHYGPFLLLGIIVLDNFFHTGILSKILIYPMKYLAWLFAGDNLLKLLPR